MLLTPGIFPPFYNDIEPIASKLARFFIFSLRPLKKIILPLKTYLFPQFSTCEAETNIIL